MTTRFGMIALVAALLVVPSACSRSVAVEGDDLGMPAPAGAVTLGVQNNNWADVNVFAVVDGSEYRLGTVTTNQTLSVELPSIVRSSGSFRLRLDPIGGGPSFLTDVILASPGQHISVNVANAIQQSSYSVH